MLSGSSGAISNWYAFGPGANDVLTQAGGAGTTRATYVPDIQGSIVASLDASSGTLTKAGFQPYGENSSPPSTYGYTGARIDAETNGLYNMRTRIYSPVLGRFMQTDPIGTKGGVNLYAYVGNDPLNRTDPSGKDHNINCVSVIASRRRSNPSFQKFLDCFVATQPRLRSLRKLGCGAPRNDGKKREFFENYGPQP